MPATVPYSRSGRDTSPMHQDLEQLKQRISLLDYLQQRNWTARRSGSRQEFVGFCPFHAETRPSFYVNARKNLFYCHGCERGGDLIRFVELSEHLSFRESLAYLKQHKAAAPECELRPCSTSWVTLISTPPCFMCNSHPRISGGSMTAPCRTEPACPCPKIYERLRTLRTT